MLTLTKVTASGTKMAVGDAAVTAILGYAIVFVGLIVLMYVVVLAGKIMVALSNKKAASETAAAPAAAGEPAAPGSAGNIKLHDVSDRDAAMLMAIVADKTGKPLNELRFKSIKEEK